MPPFTPTQHDDRSLPELLHRASGPVVVESYHGGWDLPWRALEGDAWERVRSALGDGVRCALVETSANRQTALRFGLEIVPEVLVFLDGVVVARFRHRAAPDEVVAAVQSALRERRIRDEALGELMDDGAVRETLTPARTVMRSRSGAAVASLSRAG